MSTESLREEFKELYEIEKIARDLYSNIVKNVTDKEIKREVEKICDDEKRHMRLVMKALRILG